MKGTRLHCQALPPFLSASLIPAPAPSPASAQKKKTNELERWVGVCLGKLDQDWTKKAPRVLASQGSLPRELSAWDSGALSVSGKSEAHARAGVAPPESRKTKQGNETDHEVSVGLLPTPLSASDDALS